MWGLVLFLLLCSLNSAILQLFSSAQQSIFNVLLSTKPQGLYKLYLCTSLESGDTTEFVKYARTLVA